MAQSEIVREDPRPAGATVWRPPASTDTLTRILDLVEDAILSIDCDQRIVYFNQAAERIFGYSAGEIWGKPLDALLPSGFFQSPGAQVVELTGSVQLSRPMPVRHKIGARRKNGEGFPAEALISKFQSQDGWMHTVILRDMTTYSQGVSGRSESRTIEGTERSEVSAEKPDVLEDTSENPCTQEFIAGSKSMRQLLIFAKRIAESEASTILIEGESGVGKDVLARFIHASSRRRSNAFLALNCAAIPETLLESELFGYEKGAFTDARHQKRGILELASDGTFFLDEVGELPLILQAKLLRVLEGQPFRRLGSTKDLRVNMRVITATNSDLKKAIAQGKFRLDLYYRLNVIEMTIPPLRERKDDMMPLAQHFVAFYNRKFGRQVHGLRADAWSELHAHTWPGNVRELRNAIERAMLIQEGEWIRATDLGIADDSLIDVTTEDDSRGDPSLAEIERATLVRALKKASWNQTQASHLLGISRDTLRHRIKKFDLRPRVRRSVTELSGQTGFQDITPGTASRPSWGL